MERQKVRDFFEKSGLKQKKIAEVLNVNYATFRKWLSDDKQDSLSWTQLKTLDDFIYDFYNKNTYMSH